MCNQIYFAFLAVRSALHLFNVLFNIADPADIRHDPALLRSVCTCGLCIIPEVKQLLGLPSPKSRVRSHYFTQAAKPLVKNSVAFLLWVLQLSLWGKADTRYQLFDKPMVLSRKSSSIFIFFLKPQQSQLWQ